MFEMINQKYVPIRVQLDGETKVVPGRGKGNDNKIKINVDSEKDLPGHVKDLLKAGYVTVKKTDRVKSAVIEADSVINEDESKTKKK